MAASVALTHHEKWDGGGYPQGLSGEAIPLESRIVAIADVFDALTSNRPYRPARPEDEALTIIEAHGGQPFRSPRPRRFPPVAAGNPRHPRAVRRQRRGFSPAGRSTGVSERVLYMEDDAAQARLVQKCLERVGYAVDLASDGAAGLAQCAACPYAAVIVDQTMPGLSGLDVIRAIAAQDSAPPTIMVTAPATNRSPSRR